MRLLHAHRRAMTEFDTRVRAIRDDQWDNGTPCAQWSVRDLVQHLVSEQLWAPRLLDGATLEEVGDRFDGDVLGTDPKRAWTEASTEARRAWDRPAAATGEVHVTGGVIPAEDYGWQMTLDLAVHAWDLACGVGADTRLDPDLVAVVRTVFEPQVASWQDIGIFDPPLPVPGEADEQTRLLAMLGRDAREQGRARR
ncbi:TIGR03086 family protein [Saccharopolyspora erythraea]|uniref:TIGR03086 family metal-binding protein n=1 Tax=Saccharopolyspora erythraea TaxID=1836 RepID=UPI001BA4D1EE|nr:TIGR03086 family metal-binding protein [Saccharopolyspora erythraea]QUH02747.1 TIGR03086 family protein [Saccharopolyspora erythraea]